MISPNLTNCFIIFEITLGSPSWATMDKGVFIHQIKNYKTVHRETVYKIINN